MQFIPASIRGPLFMIVSTGSYLVNDTMMKLATAGLPSYEVLFLRGVAATLWGFPLLFLLGYGKQIPLIFDKRVLRRNLLELAAILCYVVALANMQIAGAGFFLIFGHFFIFMAYRVGPTSAVAPFYYSFTVWAVISGLLVFGQFPNALAVCGILLVVGSGLTIVSLDQRKRRLTVVA